MGLRPCRVDRNYSERPYTRIAIKVHNKNYIKGIPGSKINKFEMGIKNGNYDLEYSIYPDRDMQIRHNAIEACRVAANTYLRKKITTQEFFIKVRVFPHQILREHAQAAVAQADRFYDGMRKPFGRPVGRAARVKKEQPILTIYSFRKYEDAVKEGCKRAGFKIPYTFKLVGGPIGAEEKKEETS